jgi:sarcosine oxidase delta subunit
MSQSEFEVQCPFCGETINLEFYQEEGEAQEMVIDCEVCCNPIQYNVKFDRDGDATITAERAQ